MSILEILEAGAVLDTKKYTLFQLGEACQEYFRLDDHPLWVDQHELEDFLIEKKVPYCFSSGPVVVYESSLNLVSLTLEHHGFIAKK
jgi:hypothetical protein